MPSGLWYRARAFSATPGWLYMRWRRAGSCQLRAAPRRNAWINHLPMSGMRPCRDGGSAAERTTAPAAIAVGHFLCRASAKVYFWWHGALKARPISSADLGTAPVTPS